MPIDNAGLVVAVLWLAAVTSAWAVVLGATPPRLVSENGSAHRQTRHSRAAGEWLPPRQMQELLRQEGGEDARAVDCCPTVLEMVQPTGGRNQDGMYVLLYGEGANKQRFYESSCRQDVEGKPCRFIERKLHNQSRCEQKYSYTYAIVRYPPGSTEDSSGDGGDAATGAGENPATGDAEVPATDDGEDPATGDAGTTRQPSFTHPGFFSAGTAASQGKWVLDYIRVRSGCGCVVVPKPARKKRPRKTDRPRPHKNHAEESRERDRDVMHNDDEDNNA